MNTAALRDAMEADDIEAARRILDAKPELANSVELTPPPLHFMVWMNKRPMVELLLDYEADLELKDQDNQTTPLRYAIMYCRQEMISLLIERGANTGPIDDRGTSALDVARNGAAGAYEEFQELPPRSEYQVVVELLQRLGVAE